jgi:exopolysaccharide production protein ExoZ
MFSLLFVLRQKTLITLFTIWLLVVAMINMGWLQFQDRVLLKFLFDAMHLEFVLGMLIAWSILRFKIKKGAYWLTGGIALFPVVWLLRILDPSFAYSNVLYTVGSSLLLLGIGSIQIATPKGLGFAQFLGNASYSILLTSLGFLSLDLKLAKAARLDVWCGPTLTTIVCFLAALSMCCAFYYYVERPLVSRLKSITGSKLAMASKV